MKEADLDALKALLEKATPGPWTAKQDGRRLCPWRIETAEAHVLDIMRCRVEGHGGYDPEAQANAELIVAAVNALPDLIDRLQAAEATVQSQAETIGRLVEGLKGAIEHLEQTLLWPEGWECSADELLGGYRALLSDLAMKGEGK